ncbi:hypothetical protein [Niallia sp. 03190]
MVIYSQFINDYFPSKKSAIPWNGRFYQRTSFHLKGVFKSKLVKNDYSSL